MRKWTYLVAALLMSGTAATFTSCIDNMEPAGIEAMRTAKAEFYSAQARYKKAQAAWEEANALVQAEKAKQEEITTKMKDLQYQLAEANNAMDIEAINMKLEELQEAHKVSMKDYQTQLADAEAAYQTALRDLDLIVSRLNSDYTNEYNRILASITANRTQYNKLAADLIKANLLLNQFSERTLDTISVRGLLERTKINAKQTLDDLEAQKKLLLELNGADSQAMIELANELNTTIRTKVEEYNTKVKELDNKESEESVATAAVTTKRNELINAYQPKFEATKSETYAIDPAIQHEFIVANSLQNEEYVTKTEIISFMNDQEIINYYTFTDGNLPLEIKATDLTSPITGRNTTAGAMSTTLTNLDASTNGKYANIDTPIKEEEVNAKLSGLRAWLSEIETTYNNEIEDNYTPAKTAYLDARADYMIDAETSWYNKVENAITAYTQITTPTDADKDNLIAILTEYAPIRKAYDGYVHITGTGDNAKETWTTIDKTNITVTIANDIKGTANVLTTNNDGYETSALGEMVAISTKLFGTTTSPVLAIPDSVAAEYNYTENFPTSSPAGNKPNYGTSIFGQYYNAYKAVKELEEEIEWKALHETLSADQVKYYTETLEYQNVTNIVEKDPDLVTLKETELAIKDEIAILEDLVGTNATVVTVQVASDNSTDNDVSTMDLNGLITSPGSMGSYLSTLLNYYNSVCAGNNDFNSELTALKSAIEDAQENLFNAEAALDNFDAGGYKLSSKTSVVIGKNESEYAEISLINQSGNTYTYQVIVYNADGTTKTVNTITTTDANFSTNFNNVLNAGSDIKVESGYLKVIIEAYDAKVKNINAQMADLDAIHLILQKELAAFMEVLNERYPEATAGN